MSNRFSRRSLFFIIAVLICVSFTSSAFAAASRAVEGRSYGLVISTNLIADEVGHYILEKGGNAIDAAAAVGYALAVVHPAAGNIGGGGFAVIRLASGDTYALDYREMAPGASTWDMFIDTNHVSFDVDDPRTYRARTYRNPVTGRNQDTASLVGPLASGVPGSVAGLNEMVRRFGTKPLKDIIEPAIELAEYGYILASGLNTSGAAFVQFDGTRRHFTKNGTAYAAGEKFVQGALANTLKRIALSGDAGFYEGPTADMIIADMVKYGGIITSQDLRNYKPVWREPIRGTYRGFNITSMPPPSSGGALVIQILNIIENENIGTATASTDARHGFNSPRTIHLMAEAMRYSFRDRGEYMADPDHAPVVLNYVRDMTSKAYAKRVYDKIIAQDGKAGPANPDPGFGPFNEGYTGGAGEHTTHYSVIDRWGNAVAITTTINGSYGNSLVVDGAGFFLNNEMDDLTAVPGQPNLFGVIQGWVNVPAPGKRPLSSMSPTIVTRGSDNSVFMLSGSPGGTRIITHTLHSIVNAIDFGMTVNQAVAAPRFHLQWPTNNLERETYPESRWPTMIEQAMRDMGYTIAGAGSVGDLSTIMVGARTGTGRAVTGMHDPRVFYAPYILRYVAPLDFGEPFNYRYTPPPLTIAPKNITLKSGESRTLITTFWNTSDSNVTWQTSDSSIATAVPPGVVIANSMGKAGTVTITATGIGRDTAVVTVLPVEVTGVSLNRSTSTIEVGKTEQLFAFVTPDNATDKSVTWRSSASSVATVSSTGLVTAVASGRATITATSGGKAATCEITVPDVIPGRIPVETVTVSPKTATLYVGDTQQLTATVAPTNASDRRVTWTSLNNNVATVSNAGLVSALRAGSAVILVAAMDGGKFDTCEVTVRKKSDVSTSKPIPAQDVFAGDPPAGAKFGNSGQLIWNDVVIDLNTVMLILSNADLDGWLIEAFEFEVAKGWLAAFYPEGTKDSIGVRFTLNKADGAIKVFVEKDGEVRDFIIEFSNGGGGGTGGGGGGGCAAGYGFLLLAFFMGALPIVFLRK